MDRHSIYRTIFSSKAQREIAESWNWYEDRQLGLGDRFLNEIAEHIRKIEQTPIRFPIRFKSYREAPVPVFPFLHLSDKREEENHSNSFSISHIQKSNKEVLRWEAVQL